MSTADGREIYILGKQAYGNREAVIQEDGTTHDLPAAAKFTYADQVTSFPYEVAA
jgi:hypothetical protein